MKTDLPHPLQRLRWLLLGGVLGVNLLTCGLAYESARQSREHYVRQAEVSAQNLVFSVEQRITSNIEKVDIALRNVVDQLESQLARSGSLRAQETNALIARYLRWLPEMEGIRIADKDGRVILGPGVDSQRPVDWSDRSYFLRHKQERGLLDITKPVFGRVAGTWIIGLSRRYESADGSFAGVVSATIPLKHLSNLLAGMSVGAHGAATIRDLDLGLVARYPNPVQGKAGEIGSQIVSTELQQIRASGVPQALYRAVVASDSTERLNALRRVDKAQLYVIVGLASTDYLQVWHEEVRYTIAFLLLFLVLSSGGALFFWRQVRLGMHERSRSRIFFNRASDGIHILDERGHIVDANPAFARMLGYTREQLLGMHVREWEACWGTPNVSMDALARFIGSDEPVQFESQHRRSDGQIIDVQLNLVGFDFDDQRLLYASVRDISEQKRIDAELREREELFSVISTQSEDGLLLIDPINGNFIEFNDAACHNLGYGREEFAGMHLKDIQVELDEEEIEHRLQLIERTGQVDFETVHRCRDGSLRQVRVRKRIIRFRGHSLIAATWIDITESKLRRLAETYSNEGALIKFEVARTLQEVGLAFSDRLQQALAAFDNLADRLPDRKSVV